MKGQGNVQNAAERSGKAHAGMKKDLKSMDERLEELKDFMQHAKERHGSDSRPGASSHWKSGAKNSGQKAYPDRVISYNKQRSDGLTYSDARPEPVDPASKTLPNSTMSDNRNSGVRALLAGMGLE
jgi:hypothetical protein